MSMKKSMEKTYGPEKAKQVAFAVATQQAHKVGKSPKTHVSKETGERERFGTPEGRAEAKAKFDKPKSEYKKTASAIMFDGFADELSKIAAAKWREVLRAGGEAAQRLRRAGAVSSKSRVVHGALFDDAAAINPQLHMPGAVPSKVPGMMSLLQKLPAAERARGVRMMRSMATSSPTASHSLPWPSGTPAQLAQSMVPESSVVARRVVNVGG